MGSDVALRQWVKCERGYHVHENIWEASQREIAPVLICLLWLLPSVVNERGISPAFCSCLRLQLRCLLCESTQLKLEAGPCGYGALLTGRSSKTEPHLSNSTRQY